MAESFRFKQFEVFHGESTMKVGTDGVSLGSWGRCQGRVLDVGCGCGLIGLMAAQRGAEKVEMIDIDAASVAEASENAASSPWAERVSVRCGNFLTAEFSERYDNILSNPPFFSEGLRAPDNRRAGARHCDALAPDWFMGRAASLLAPEGEVSVIIPPDREEEWTFAARIHGLEPKRIADLMTKPGAPARRVMIAFSREVGECRRCSLALNSPEYKELTSPFYL